MNDCGKHFLLGALCFALSTSWPAQAERNAPTTAAPQRAVEIRPVGVGSHPVERIGEKQGEFAELRSALGDLFAEITGLKRDSFEVRWDYRKKGVVAAIVTEERLRDAELSEAFRRSGYPELKRLQEDAKAGRLKKKAILLVSPHLIDWALEEVSINDPINGTSQTAKGDDSRLRYVLLHEFGHEVSSGKSQAYLENPENWKNNTPEEWYLRSKRHAFEEFGSKGYEVFSDLFAQEQEIRNGGNPLAGDEITLVMKKRQNERESLASAIAASHPKASTRLDFLQADRSRLRRIGVYRAAHDNYQRADSVIRKIHALRFSPDYERDVSTITQRLIRESEADAISRIRSASLPSKDEKTNKRESTPELNVRLLDISLHQEVDAPYDSHLEASYQGWIETATHSLRKTLMREIAQRMADVSKTISSDAERIQFLSTIDALIERGLRQSDTPSDALSRLNQLRTPVAAHVEKLFLDAWYGRSEGSPKAILESLAPGYSTHWTSNALGEFAVRASKNEDSLAGTLAHLQGEIAKVSDGKRSDREKEPLHFRVPNDVLIPFIERASLLYPSQVVHHLSDLSKILADRREYGLLTAEELDALRPKLQSAIDRFQWQGIKDFDVGGFLASARDFGLDVSSHRDALERHVRNQFDPSTYNSSGKLRRLLDLADQHPQMKPIVAPLILQYVNLVQDFFKNRGRYQTVIEAIRDRYQAKHADRYRTEDAEELTKHFHYEVFDFVGHVVEKRKDFGEVEKSLQQIEAHLRKEIDQGLQIALQEPDEKLAEKVAQVAEWLKPGKASERATHSLREALSDFVPYNSFSGKTQFRITPNAALKFALIRHREYPELMARLRPLRLSILSQVFGKHTLHEVDVRRLFNRLYSEQEARKALQNFLETVEPHRRYNPSTDLAHIFGKLFTPKDLLEARIPFHRKAQLVNDFRPTIETEADVSAILTLVQQGSEELKKAEIEFSEFLKDTDILLKRFPYSKSYDGIASHARDAAVYSYLRSLARLPQAEQISKLENLLFEVIEKNSPYQKAAVEQLNQAVPRDWIAKRMEWIGEAQRVPFLKSAEFIGPLLEDVLRSNAPIEDRLKWMKRLQTHLSAKDLQRAWTVLSPEAVYNSAYDPQKAERAIHSIYGDYFDGMAQKLNEVMEHYELDEAQMRALRKTVFGDKESAIAGKEIEILRLAIEANLSDDATHLEFIRWLQGKTTTVPEMAQEIVSSIAKAAGEYWEGDERVQANIRKEDFVRLISERATEERLLDTYRNNPMLARAAMISPILSSNQEKGMLSRPEGLQSFVRYITDGMEQKNISLARALLRSHLRSLGRDAHLFASQVIAGANARATETSDPEKLKAVLEGKGALWIKLGQMLYADKHLIPDDSVREVFRQLLDSADKPYRERLFQMLRAELGDQFGKILHVERVFGSGSVNISVGVRLKNGNQYVARFVRDDPWSDTEAELLALEKMRGYLHEEAELTDDPELQANLKKISATLEEHVESIGRKIKVESDHRMDRKVTEKLRQAGTYHQDYADLGVEVRLVTEAKDTGMEYDFSSSAPASGKLARAKRVIFYPFVPNELEKLSASEKRRALRAALRAEYQGLFVVGAYDPDGHLGNFRIHRHATKPGVIVVNRIDTSQAEFLEPHTQNAFREVIAGLTRTKPQGLFEHYAKLIDWSGDASVLKTSFENALAETGKLSHNPISRFVDVHAKLKQEFEGQLKLSFPIQMALKSLHTTQQLLDARNPAERAIFAEEFARSVLGQGRLRAKISAAAVATKAWWEKGKRAASLLVPEKPSAAIKARHHEFLEGLSKLSGVTPSRWEDLKEYANFGDAFARPISEALLQVMQDKPHSVEGSVRDEILDKLIEWSPHGLKEQAILEKLAGAEDIHALERLAHQYPSAFLDRVPEWLARSDSFQNLLEHSLLYSPELRDELRGKILTASEKIPFWHIARLPQIAQDPKARFSLSLPANEWNRSVELLHQIQDPNHARALRKRLAEVVLQEVNRRIQWTPEQVAQIHQDEGWHDALHAGLDYGGSAGAITLLLENSELSDSQKVELVLQLNQFTDRLADPGTLSHMAPTDREQIQFRIDSRRESLAKLVENAQGLSAEMLRQLALQSGREDLVTAALGNLVRRTRLGAIEEKQTRALLRDVSHGAFLPQAKAHAARLLSEKVLSTSLNANAKIRNLPDGYRIVHYPKTYGGAEAELHLQRMGEDGSYRNVHSYHPVGDDLIRLVEENRTKPSPLNVLKILLEARTLAGRLRLVVAEDYGYTLNWPNLSKGYPITKKDARELHALLQNPPPSRAGRSSHEMLTRGLDIILREARVLPEARADLLRLTPSLHVEIKQTMFSSDRIPEQIQVASAHAHHRDLVLRGVEGGAVSLPVADHIIESLQKDGVVNEELSEYLRTHFLGLEDALRLNAFLGDRSQMYHSRVRQEAFKSIHIPRVLSRLRFENSDAMMSVYRFWRDRLSADKTQDSISSELGQYSAHGRKELHHAVEQLKQENTERLLKTEARARDQLAPYAPYDCTQALYKLAL